MPSRRVALTADACHQRLHLVVGVDGVEQPLELAVAARGDGDPDVGEASRGGLARPGRVAHAWAAVGR